MNVAPGKVLEMLVNVSNKVAAHRSFKPPKHDLGRVQSIQKCRRCAICAIECQKKHENVSRSSNEVRLILFCFKSLLQVNINGYICTQQIMLC